MTLTFFAGMLGLGVIGLHLHDQIFWMDNFSDVQKFGDRCSYAVGKWPGSYAQAIGMEQRLVPFAMPHRGKANAPRAYTDDFLKTVCEVDLTAVGVTDYARIDLGSLFGHSMIYLGDQEFQFVAAGARSAFQAPQLVKGRKILVTIISRGDAEGAVGMATLRPPYLATSADQASRIDRWLNAKFTEQPMFRIGATLLMFLILTALWFYGLRHADVQWLAGYAGVILVINVIQYSLQFNLSFRDLSERLMSAANFSQYFCLFFFLKYFMRSKMRITNLDYSVAFLWTALVCMSFLVSDAVFFAWRLQVRAPTQLGFLLLAAAFLWVALDRKNAEKVLAAAYRRRLTKILLASTLVIIGVQFYLDDKYGIYIDGLAQFSCFAMFFSLLLSQLSQRQGEYFKERERAKTIAETARFIGHDLQKPFAAMQMLIDKMSGLSVAEIQRMKKTLHATMQAAKLSAVQLMDDLNEFDVDSYPKDNWQLIKVRTLLDSAAKLPLAERKNIEFVNAVPDEIVLMGDKRSLLRVFENIFQNAVDAISKDGKIHSAHKQNRDKTLTITIKNTGSSIAREDLERVFTFNFTRGKMKGRGLGLAHAKQVVEANHKGKIWCESENNETSFHICLSQLKPKQTSNLRNVRIAIIDDDKFVHAAWRMTAKDVDMLDFASPEEFLEAINSNAGMRLESLSLVVLDKNFSNSSYNGLRFAKELKKRPGCPAILLSSFDNVNLREMHENGVDGVIDKEPLTKEQIAYYVKAN